MNQIIPEQPSREALLMLSSISEEEFIDKIEKEELPIIRKEILFDIMKNRKSIDFPEIWDIQWYALKTLFPEYYKSLEDKNHPYCKDDFCLEYDPPKNGANIIKHGISFREVVHGSKDFGRLMVNCKDNICVVFSKHSGCDYLLPLNSKKKECLYILSITKNINGKFRMISSRVFNKKETDNYKKIRAMFKGAFREIHGDDLDKENEFIERCIEILFKQ